MPLTRWARILGLIFALAAVVWFGWTRFLSPQAVGEGQVREPTTSVGFTMGTTFSVKYVAPRDAMAESVDSLVQATLDAVVESMSTYEDDSEISRLNRADAEVALPLSDDFAEVLQLAIHINGKTDGAFDPTVRPLVSAFGFGSDAAETVPTQAELAAIRDHVGIDLVEFDPNTMTLTKRIPEVQFDFDGIAKGFGVDKVAEALEGLGITNYMVEVGGEIRVRGQKAQGTPWTLAIEEPLRDGRQLHAMIKLSPEGGALATSGDYRNFREVNGQIISHTFDPRSGEPVARRTASVSVIRPTATEADALATALGVLTPQEAIALANQEGWAVYLLTHAADGSFTAMSSQAFDRIDFTAAESR